MQISKPIATALAILIFALLCLNIVLNVQNRNLKNFALGSIPALRPTVGDMLPAIEGLAVDGSRIVLSYGNDHRETFVFVFMPGFGACNLSWPLWTDFANNADARRVRLVYLNIAPTLSEAFVQLHQLKTSLLLAETDPKTVVAYKLQLTPEIIELDSQGRVRDVWLGVLEGRDLVNLKQALGVT